MMNDEITPTLGRTNRMGSVTLPDETQPDGLG